MCDILQIVILAKAETQNLLQLHIRQTNLPHKILFCANEIDHAISFLSSTYSDLIFIDVDAFDQDPIELVEKIRSTKLNSTIVLVSESYDYTFVRNALELGIKDLLRNPIDTAKIADILSHALRTKCGIIGVVYQTLMNNYSESININEIARTYNISCNHLIREFKKRYGATPLQCLTQKRLNESILLLSSTNMSVEKIAETVGYTDVKYYTILFKKHFGISPAQHRVKHSILPLSTVGISTDSN